MTGLVGDRLATPGDAANGGEMSSLVKVSRNDPCPCGDGRKYKRCCYAKAAPLVQGPDGKLAHELPIGPEVGEILQRQREKFASEPLVNVPGGYDRGEQNLRHRLGALGGSRGVAGP